MFINKKIRHHINSYLYLNIHAEKKYIFQDQISLSSLSLILAIEC